MPGKKEEEYFVGISEPIEIRRGILESAKKMIHMLQKYERFKTMRHRKIEHINKLNETIKEINLLISKLKAELPKPQKTIRTIRKTDEDDGTEEMPVKKKSAKPKSELERLEAELGKVEEQLTHLE